MEDQDQTPRQIGLCCAGERFFTIVGVGTWDLANESFETLVSLYGCAQKAGREDAMRGIRREIERRLPWPKS